MSDQADNRQDTSSLSMVAADHDCQPTHSTPQRSDGGQPARPFASSWQSRAAGKEALWAEKEWEARLQGAACFRPDLKPAHARTKPLIDPPSRHESFKFVQQHEDGRWDEHIAEGDQIFS